jgi:hypothetical protein
MASHFGGHNFDRFSDTLAGYASHTGYPQSDTMAGIASHTGDPGHEYDWPDTLAGYASHSRDPRSDTLAGYASHTGYPRPDTMAGIASHTRDYGHRYDWSDTLAGIASHHGDNYFERQDERVSDRYQGSDGWASETPSHTIQTQPTELHDLIQTLKEKLEIELRLYNTCDISQGLASMDDLLRRGENPNAVNRDGQTALNSLAVGCPINEREDRLQMMKILTQHGADVNHMGQHGMSPFHNVCHSGWTEAAEHFHVRGARINSPCRSPCYTPLHLAAMRNHGHTADFLLTRRAHTHQTSLHDETPAEVAHRLGHFQMSDMLNESSRMRALGFPHHPTY